MKEFNIQYPPLVEQAYGMLLSLGETDLTKQDIYITMVQNGFITEDGKPTKKAIEEKLVKEVTVDNPIKEFKQQYPQLAFIPDDEFQVVDGEVLFNKSAMLKTCNLVLQSSDFTEKQKSQAKQWIKEINEKF